MTTRPKAWTWDEEQSLIDGVLSGESVMESSTRLNRSTHSIDRKRALLRSQGRLPNCRGKPWDSFEDAKLLRLVKQGMRYSEIARLLDRTQIAVKLRRKILLAPQKPAGDSCTARMIISAWQYLSDGVKMRTVMRAE